MKTKIIVGGLDPSLSSFGMSKGTVVRDSESGEVTLLKVVKSCLTISKSDKTVKYKNMDDLQRAKQLGADMLDFFDNVDHIYVEIPVGSQSARAMASYGICVGVIAALGDRVIRVSAKDVKLIATGDPKASKQDMIDWATSRYPELPWATKTRKGEVSFTGANEHVADSIAAIHAGLNLK